MNLTTEAAYLASVYQNLIKPLCVFHIYDSQNGMYSFAVKRLNQTDESQIVVDTRGMLKKAVTGTEKVRLNKEIKKMVQVLDEM